MKRIWYSIAAITGLSAVTMSLVSGPEIHAQHGSGRPVTHPERPYHPISEPDRLIEVVVDGRARDLYQARGKRYVEAIRGEEYAIRIRNPYSVRVAVALSVDGLNTIDARRTSRWEASKWVIEPYQTITITGWQMSAERARRFYFTSERDSYAARINRASDLGVISAVFFRERTYAYTRPRPYPMEDERSQGGERNRKGESDASSAPQSARSKSGVIAPPHPADDDYAATGIGRSVRNDVRWTHLDLDQRPAHEVTIRYEYHDALVRLGVLPRAYPRPEPLGRRERARGFEDQRFSPEP